MAHTKTRASKQAVPPRTNLAPRQDRRAERRRAIIESAARRFAQDGYAGCDMEAVAADCGIAKGTVYLYFPGKQELFLACTDWGMRQMQEAVLSSAAGDDDPFERIRRAIRTYLLFFDEHPEYVELLIQERALFKDRKRPTYFEYRDANIGYWRDLYGQLAKQGRVRSDIAVERLVDTIGSLLYGTMFLNHFVGRRAPFQEQYETLLKIMFEGILSDTERQHRD